MKEPKQRSQYKRVRRRIASVKAKPGSQNRSRQSKQGESSAAKRSQLLSRPTDGKLFIILLLTGCLIFATLIVGLFKFRSVGTESGVAEPTTTSTLNAQETVLTTANTAAAENFTRPDIELSDKRGRRHYTYLPEAAKRLFFFRDNLISADGNYLSYLTIDGKAISEEPAEFNRPFVVDSNAETALVADLQGQSVGKIDGEGVKKIFKLDNVCVGGAINGKSNYALIEVTAQRQGLVHVYDYENDNRIFTIQFADSGYPVDLRFNPSGNRLDVLLSVTRGNVLQTVLKSYDLSGKQLSETTLSNDGQLMVELTYDRAGRIVVVGAHSCLRLNEQGEIEKFSFAGSLIHLLKDNDQLSFLVNNEQQKLSLLQINGDQLSVTDIPLRHAGVEAGSLHNNLLLLSVGTEIYRFDLQSKQFLDYLDMGSPVLSIEQGDENTVVLTSNVLLTLE